MDSCRVTSKTGSKMLLAAVAVVLASSYSANAVPMSMIQDNSCWMVSDPSTITAPEGWEHRGVYRDFSLLYASSTACASARNDSDVWVLELSGVNAVNSAIRTLPEEIKVIHTAGNSLLVTNQVLNVDLYGILGQLLENTISVPPTAVRYNKEKFTASSYYSDEHIAHINSRIAMVDPEISQLLSQVDGDKIIETITRLQNTYQTRLSISEEALIAESDITKLLVELGYEVSTFNFREGFSGNVIATLRGTTNPDEYVIAGAHYDSRSTDLTDPKLRAPGADDNGSGTAHVLEMARVIAESKKKFKYSIRLILFSGEEQGLLGSRAYAQELAKEDVKVLAMFNADMLGWKLPGTEKPKVGMKDRYVSEWLLNVANALSGTYVTGLDVGYSASCCSDHQSFTENGFPAIGYFENVASASSYPHYHKSTDLVQYLDKDNIVLISRACFASVLTFAVIDNE